MFYVSSPGSNGLTFVLFLTVFCFIVKLLSILFIENRGKRDIVTQLVQRGYQSDPVKAWKSSIAKDQLGEETQSETGSVMSGELGGPDFSYILSMHLLSLSKEKKEELLKTRDAKVNLTFRSCCSSLHDLFYHSCPLA